jgi:hypothetical protein
LINPGGGVKLNGARGVDGVSCLGAVSTGTRAGRGRLSTVGVGGKGWGMPANTGVLARLAVCATGGGRSWASRGNATKTAESRKVLERNNLIRELDSSTFAAPRQTLYAAQKEVCKGRFFLAVRPVSTKIKRK